MASSNQWQTSGNGSQDQRILAAITHISAIFPLGFGFVGPLIIYLIKKDEGGFVAENARNALNFQLTMLILNAIAWFLVIILIGFVMLWVLGIINVVLVIIAAWKSYEGYVYNYPFTIEIVR